MFDFRKISIKDREAICERLAVSDLRGGEYSFANNLAWHRLSDYVICLHNDFYINCGFDNEEPFFIFPAGVRTDNETGREKYIKLFEELKKFCDDKNKRFRLVSVTQKDVDWLKQYYGERISVEYDRDGSDYIYNSSDLIELPGKKYHSKRNHINRFMEAEWTFEPLDETNFDECIAFSAGLYNVRGDIYGSAVIEQYAINVFFMNLKELGLKAALLRREGELVGYSIGEQLNSDTFIVHIEKARADIHGAYPMLCNMFAKTYAEQFQYISREEDMGIDGLRRSKMSYHPVFLVDKYTVDFK